LRRPVVIVSADVFNRSRIRTVGTVSITSRLRLAGARGNVLLAAGEGGLTKASVVNVTQVATLDRDDLIERVGRLDAQAMLAVDAGLRFALGL
jgi:mRNA interferase MazF